jgi:hypothetical protein
MQIHEVTQPVREGLFDAFRKPESVAADAAGKLTAQGYGTAFKAPSDKWEDKYARVSQDPGVKQYVKGLAQEWPSSAQAQAIKATPPAAASTKPTVATTPAPTQPIMLGGKRLDPKNPKDAQVLAAMQAQGKLQEAPQEYTTPSGIVVPGGTKTDVGPSISTPPAPVATNYQEKFVEWSDSQLASRDPITRQSITMDDVRAKFPDLNERLNKFLGQIVKTHGTAQQSAAIEEYAKLAVSGIQAIAQTSRNRAPQQRTTDLGVSPQQLASLRALGQTPAGKDLLIKQLGLRP